MSGQDQIDAAIAAVAKTAVPQQARMTVINVTLGTTGRVVQIAVPVDIQLIEAVDLVQWLLNTAPGGGLQGHLEKVNATPQFEIARTLPPGLPKMPS